MQIGLVTQFLTPKGGGAARSTYNLALSLKSRGHHVTVFTSDWGMKEARFEQEKSLEMVVSRCKVDAFGFLYTPGMKKELEAHSRVVDLLDFNNFRTYQNVVASRFAARHGVPYVVRARGSMPLIGKAYLKRMFDQVYGDKILGGSSKVIALTNDESNQYRDFGIPPQKISIIPNGVDLSSYTDQPPRGTFRSAHGIAQGEKMVLYLGRIHKIKGIDTLLKSWALLHRGNGHPNAGLVIAGPDDGYLKNAVSLTKQLQIESGVMFCGPLGEVDKLAALVDADMIINPSYYETFPNTVLEAFACSRPVIASRVLSMNELVREGETGLLVEPGDPAGLAKAIASLFESPDLGEALGKSGRRLVEEEYNMELITTKVERLYGSILGVG